MPVLVWFTSRLSRLHSSAYKDMSAQGIIAPSVRRRCILAHCQLNVRSCAKPRELVLDDLAGCDSDTRGRIVIAHL